MRSFKDDLLQSELAADLPHWDECYRKAFPSMIWQHHFPNDGGPQRAGVDRVIVLADSRVIRVDDKLRYENYNDIALETFSDFDRKILGWISKPMLCDYIGYAILPSRKFFLLPVPQLQAAWKINGESWSQKYPQKYSQNNGYRTAFVPVPPDVLRKALGVEFTWGEIWTDASLPSPKGAL